MRPSRLTPAQFTAYPLEAQRLVAAHLELFRRMPLAFLPSLFRELIEYDYKFPAERVRINQELACLSALTPQQTTEWFLAFSQLRLSPSQENFDWVNHPLLFTEQFSAYLWSTHQMDAFRHAAATYGDRLRTALPANPLLIQRLGIAVIGQGVASYDGVLFQNLRSHGTYFTRVDPDRGLDYLISAAAERAKAHPAPYSHWYIDGGTPANYIPPLTCVSYAALSPVRSALLNRIQSEVGVPGMGPEELRDYLTKLSPSDLGLRGDTVLDRFQLNLLTEGSGTQIFSTTFAQWAAREVLRRAEAPTLLVRYAPRQRQRPMNELLSNSASGVELDPAGSLIDADMGAYYQWINQQRLPGASQSSFLVWFEGHNQALGIGPALPRGTESRSPLNLERLVHLVVAA